MLFNFENLLYLIFGLFTKITFNFLKKLLNKKELWSGLNRKLCFVCDLFSKWLVHFPNKQKTTKSQKEWIKKQHNLVFFGWGGGVKNKTLDIL